MRPDVKEARDHLTSAYWILNNMKPESMIDKGKIDTLKKMIKIVEQKLTLIDYKQTPIV